MLEKLKEKVCKANQELQKYHLVTLTWGNVSEFDPASGLLVIKPSGINYEDLTPESMVIVDLEGNVKEGALRPSSDTLTHIELYRNFPKIRGIVHTHSSYATSFAQAGKAIECLGTTHADYFYGEIPCLRNLTTKELEDYERNTGKMIAAFLKQRDPLMVPAILCKNHGPFTWGKDAFDALHNAVVLEEIAKMNIITKNIYPQVKAAPQNLQNKHYFRKHGSHAYYGQQQDRSSV